MGELETSILVKLHIMLKTIGELKRSKLYLYDITIDEQYAYYRVDVMLNSNTILIKELWVRNYTCMNYLN